MLAVLHRGVHRRGPDTHAPHAPPDHVLALAVYLLDVAATLQMEQKHEEAVRVNITVLILFCKAFFWYKIGRYHF